MCVTGSLIDFSLPEIFQFLEKGQKTGLLTLWSPPESEAVPERVHYLWVRRGRIVAAANRLDDRGLVSSIVQRQWASNRVIAKLAQLCPKGKPLGLALNEQGVLETKQLRRLFQMQVLQQVCTLFQIKDGHFKFEPHAPIPAREMTGFSAPATEATLVGLRMLRNWDALVGKLPNPEGGLVSAIAGQPHYQLDRLEWQVWEYTKGTMPLKAIAGQLRLPVETVQQIAFRLITVGIAEEVPLVPGSFTTPDVESLSAPLIKEAESQNISPSFLQNLMGFLWNKV
jgi:hypothetical protein